MRFDTKLYPFEGGSHETVREADSPEKAAVEAFKGWRSDVTLDDRIRRGKDLNGEYVEYHGFAGRRVATVYVYVGGFYDGV